MEGCRRAAWGQPYCVSHYRRKKAYGDPLATPIGQRGAIEWVAAAIVVAMLSGTDDCILHPFGTKEGYGSGVNFQGKRLRLHELVLIFTGRVPPGTGGATRHLCGVPKCLNFRHITPGTGKENYADAVRHGTAILGEMHYMALITADDARAIRASSERSVVLGERYGISRQAVADIRAGRTWKHVD